MIDARQWIMITVWWLTNKHQRIATRNLAQQVVVVSWSVKMLAGSDVLFPQKHRIPTGLILVESHKNYSNSFFNCICQKMQCIDKFYLLLLTIDRIGKAAVSSHPVAVAYMNTQCPFNLCSAPGAYPNFWHSCEWNTLLQDTYLSCVFWNWDPEMQVRVLMFEGHSYFIEARFCIWHFSRQY